jgi:hypothetical protein
MRDLSFFVSLLVFETGSHYIAQSGLELMILLSQIIALHRLYANIYEYMYKV